ncbi:MAG: 16S rRNA (guanine(966)-N(2))-methyltransferase RsmD [Firmicutes bacterium]|nr:16S rRNA (guanine(966)-N(2))-methyltransferase RsmD [Bacillota bacterium]
MRIIAGAAKGRRLKTRKGTETRPTADMVKESLFNIIGEKMPGARFLDLFAGNGGVGLEALSRGAAFCLFIEKNAQCVKIIKDNLQLCGLNHLAEVRRGELPAALNGIQLQFDIIFLDPPYHSPALKTTVGKISQLHLLAPEGLLIAEHHMRDNDWFPKTDWRLVREKRYGETVLAFLVPAAAFAGKRE